LPLDVAALDELDAEPLADDELELELELFLLPHAVTPRMAVAMLRTVKAFERIEVPPPVGSTPRGGSASS
jgi:hypothetical protein